MSLIIEKTFDLLDELDRSELIKNLKYYKEKVISNKEVTDLVSKINIVDDDQEKIKLRKKLYEITDYQKYMQYYNELAMIVFQINKRYESYTNTKSCQVKLEH